MDYIIVRTSTFLAVNLTNALCMVIILITTPIEIQQALECVHIHCFPLHKSLSSYSGIKGLEAD